MRIVIPSLLLVLLSGCSKPEPVENDEMVARPVKLMRIQESGEGDWRTFPAQVQASDKTDMAFRVGGEIDRLPIKSGQVVKKGQLLAQLDPTDYQLQLDDRKARLDLATAQFKRVETMIENGLASSSQFDQSKAELEIARSAYNAAQKNLTYTKLFAPFNGVVSEIYGKANQSVAPMKPVVRLQSEEVLEISLQMPEDLVARVRKDVATGGYQPQVIFSALPGKTFYVTYKEHNAAADPQTGSYSVVFVLTRPTELNILPGMTATMRIDMSKVLRDQSVTYTVPANAVFSDSKNEIDSDTKSLWVVNESIMRAEKRAVKVGQLKQDGLEILSGLSGGELVITAGVHQIQDGQLVRAWVNERGL